MTKELHCDEIGVHEFVMMLWQGKWTVFISMISVTAIAMGYAFLAQEWWTATAKVEGYFLDIDAFKSQIELPEVVLGITQPTILVSDPTVDKKISFEVSKGTKVGISVSNSELLNLFVAEFNSTKNKKLFLSSEKVQGIKRRLGLESSFGGTFSAEVLDKGENQSATLSFKSINRQASFELLTAYISFINERACIRLKKEFEFALATKIIALNQQKQILEMHAQSCLDNEIAKAQYALAITKAAGINSPLQNLRDQDLFAINQGSKVLRAKIEVLRSITKLSVFEPRLKAVEVALSHLSRMHFVVDKSMVTFRYIEESTLPLCADNGQKKLIILLGVLLGGMIGVGTVLIRFVFKRDDAI